MIDLALVMCGGKGTRFGEDKNLYKYKNRTMISYVFDSINRSCVREVILQAEDNKDEIAYEAKGRLRDLKVNIMLDPPTAFRKITDKLKDSLDRPYFLLTGNQPMRNSYLNELNQFYLKRKGAWVASLYPRHISELIPRIRIVSFDETFRVFVDDGGGFILHPPYILDNSFLEFQSAENFRFKIEGTLGNISNMGNVYGFPADMPPEFDDAKMVERTLEFVDSLSRLK